MKQAPIKVLCVDDHKFLGEGLRARLSLEKDMEFVGWAPSAETLLHDVERTKADVVLLDIEMPGPDPFEVLADLGRAHPDVRVVMLSAYVVDHYIDRALQAGAWGYLSKSDEPDTVIDAIHKVIGGEFAFGPQVLERVQPGTTAGHQTKPPETKLSLLTPRELQILRMIGKGMSRTQIAEAVHRSPKTIDNHRAAIMEKLDIHDRVELARYAIREKLSDA